MLAEPTDNGVEENLLIVTDDNSKYKTMEIASDDKTREKIKTEKHKKSKKESKEKESKKSKSSKKGIYYYIINPFCYLY